MEVLISILTLFSPGIIYLWYNHAKNKADLLTGKKTLEDIKAEKEEYRKLFDDDDGDPENPLSPWFREF